jgi:hypothetical protein
MSSESTPITLTRFATALADLPIDAIYSKYSELRNSIAHMESSNTQLEDFARENDDRECYEAVLENRMVIKRFEERIEALKSEVVEKRGLPWRPQDEESTGKGGEAAQSGGTTNGVSEQNGTGDQDANQEDGVFL